MNTVLAWLIIGVVTCMSVSVMYGVTRASHQEEQRRQRSGQRLTTQQQVHLTVEEIEALAWVADQIEERFNQQDATLQAIQERIERIDVPVPQQRTPGDYIDLAFAEMVRQLTDRIDEKFAETNHTNEPIQSAQLTQPRSDTISGGTYDNRMRKMRIAKRSVAEIASTLGVSKRAIENRITILKKARKL